MMKPQQLTEFAPEVVEQDDPKRGPLAVYFMLERSDNGIFSYIEEHQQYSLYLSPF